MGRKTPPWPDYPAWSTAKFWAFIRSGLRSKSSRWPPKYEVMNEAKRKSQSSNKRLKWEYQCAQCKGWFPQKEVSVDHITPVGTLKDFADLPVFVQRLYCGKDGLQLLCDECHHAKTQRERSQ